MTIWAVRLDRPVSADDGGLLSSDERRRAERFYFAHHRRRFIVAHAALRRLLGRHLGIAPEAIEYQYGAHGKPALKTAPNRPLAFNLAHCGDVAVIALTEAGPVGIDLEASRPEHDLAMLARACLAPVEYRAHLRRPRAARADDFYRRWVCKEAVLKALGCGLSIEPREVVVGAPDTDWPTVLVPTAGATDAPWQLRLFTLTRNHVGAVATIGPARPIHRFAGWLDRFGDPA